MTLLGLWLLFSVVWVLAHAAETIKKSFDLPADAMEKSLKRFSEQSGLEVLFPTDAVAGVRTQSVRGAMTSRQALDGMLAGTGLGVFQDPKSGALTVKKKSDPNGAVPAPRPNSQVFAQKKTETMKTDTETVKPTPQPIEKSKPLTKLAVMIAVLLGSPASAQNTEDAASPLRGNIAGRVLNEATGQYLRSAIVTAVGTNISTVAESGGVYTLSGVPAGEVRVAVSFIGLDTAEATVKVQPGQTAVHDFSMTSKTDEIVKLGAFRVVTERDGDYKALQEKKSALEIKTVMSSDAFGDVSEGNVGEFLKLMPGVQMDYVDADVRTMSIGGLDPKYTLILMDGAPLAAAGTSGIGSGRTFEFEQLSISSIANVELSKTPTPDVSGSALAGVVNLRSKGAFDRKGRQIRWSVSGGLNSHYWLKRTPGPDDKMNLKVQPNVSLEFSDVIFAGKLGVIAGYSFARTLVEQNITSYNYTLDADPANNAIEVPRLDFLRLVDAPKLTDRSNFHLRLDYMITPELTAWARIDQSTYQAFNYNRRVEFSLDNAVNGPRAVDPQVAGVEYSQNSQTTTAGSTVLQYNVQFDKGGDTSTAATGSSFKRGAFRADVQAQVSIAKSYFRDTTDGFWGGGTSTLPNLGLRWNRSSPMDPAINFTQLSGPDWRDPASYPAGANPTSLLKGQTAKDQKWTAKADFRYSWRRWEIPVLLKWGGDISQAVRDITDSQAAFTLRYLGPDGLPNTGDERWAFESTYRQRNLQGGNLHNIPTPNGVAMRQEYRANPGRFVQPTPAQLLERDIRNHWDVKEQVDSAYQQTIIKVTKKFDLAPGVRVEKTRSAGRGPTDRGDDYANNLLTGNPNANIPTTSLDYIQARWGKDATNTSNYHTWLKYLHASYRWSDAVTLRASFNDSITRPNLNNLAGGLTINPDATPLPTANIPNPGLQPEHGKNFFASAEYYFPKGAGFVSVSGARRFISNLIRTNTVDVPVGETFSNEERIDLGGYRVTSVDNVAGSQMTNVEFSYRQNLVFLPGFWKGVSIFGNYTRLYFDDYENFRRPRQLANGGVSFDRRGLSFRWNVVYVPANRSHAPRADGWKFSNPDRLGHDVQFAYRLPKYATVFASGRNVFNRSQAGFGRGGDGGAKILTDHRNYGALWTIGVRGEF